MQFWFEKHRSDTRDPKGMFSAPSGRSEEALESIHIKDIPNFVILPKYLPLGPMFPYASAKSAYLVFRALHNGANSRSNI